MSLNSIKTKLLKVGYTEQDIGSLLEYPNLSWPGLYAFVAVKIYQHSAYDTLEDRLIKVGLSLTESFWSKLLLEGAMTTSREEGAQAVRDKVAALRQQLNFTYSDLIRSHRIDSTKSKKLVKFLEEHGYVLKVEGKDEA